MASNKGFGFNIDDVLSGTFYRRILEDIREKRTSIENISNLSSDDKDSIESLALQRVFRLKGKYKYVADDKELQESLKHSGSTNDTPGGRILVISNYSVLRRVALYALALRYKLSIFLLDEDYVGSLKSQHEKIDLILVAEDSLLALEYIKDLAQEYRIPIAIYRGNDKPLSVYSGFYYVKDFIPITPNANYKGRIDNLINLRKKESEIERLTHDPETGLFTNNAFVSRCNEYAKENNAKVFKIILFRVFSLHSFYSEKGSVEGAAVARAVSQIVSTKLNNVKFGGRHTQESFAFFVTIAKHEKVTEIVKILNESLKDDGLKVFATIVKPGYSNTFEKMLDCADFAFKKMNTKNSKYSLDFDSEMLEEMNREDWILSNLAKAIENKEFVVEYQPKVLVSNERLGGAEALVRWPSSSLYPDQFIPVLEKRHEIIVLDLYVLQTVLSDLSEWILKSERDKTINLVPISVNLSREDFKEGFAQSLISVVDEKGIPHNLIHFEVTESALSQKEDLLMTNVSILRKSGFEVELDDFGSGFSSLNVLSTMELDVIKIDKTITDGETRDNHSKILEYSIGLGKSLGINVVVEGVEKKYQVDVIKGCGADYIQGWCYSRSLLKVDFEKILFSNKPLILTANAKE